MVRNVATSGEQGAAAPGAEPLDFVITWVDGSDRAWLEKKRAYEPEAHGGDLTIDDSVSRYRDWGLLKYLFRGIEAFAPWVRKVFFVTEGHLPAWLDRDADGLVTVRHEDFMPERYLPTFSSHPIEMNMHLIPGLSEHFVYFNDDMLITRPLEPGMFFRGGLPVIAPQLHGILPRGDTGPMAHIWVNNISAINRHFDFHESIARNRGKWLNPVRIGAKAALENVYCLSYAQFPGIRHTHVPSPLRKATIAKIWDQEPELLDRTCRHKFRSAEDVSPYLFWQWELAAGSFVPRKSDLGVRISIRGDSVSRIVEAVETQRYPFICPNDIEELGDEVFRSLQSMIQAAFEKVLPAKSRFEL